MAEITSIEIDDLSREFFQEWNQYERFTIENLVSYYREFPNVFEDYFNSHCQRTAERLNSAIDRYPEKYESMKQAAQLLPVILKEVYEELSKLLGIQMSIKARILVGGFGSNAYVAHDGKMHFAIETLTGNPKYLKVLVAHEMAHTFHYELLKGVGFDFSKFALDGYTSLYLEGAATYLSEVINSRLPERVYLSFNDSGEEWIAFYKNNYKEILTSFKDDLLQSSMEVEREWFLLRGGKKFGFNRLGYLVGKDFVKYSVKEFGLKESLTFWAKNDIKSVIRDWLIQEYRRWYLMDYSTNKMNI
ncbi:peptidase MA superfamily protein [Oceanobacillus picturae]|uniref:Peptidase MA superfamily protein n=1 Tax=Oceanobacillus picturae TaxID=171693 RepID=A0A0U9H9E2_9BACI|nr:DUF5700 domain-containing putative Zn-dependent protease [Oceanobacillus picturae]GAQ19282.1 peptidase MA superfamily protein [Oceanobacillus picturae]